jgi:hypothetical protein
MASSLVRQNSQVICNVSKLTQLEYTFHFGLLQLFKDALNVSDACIYGFSQSIFQHYFWETVSDAKCKQMYEVLYTAYRRFSQIEALAKSGRFIQSVVDQHGLGRVDCPACMPADKNATCNRIVV